MLDLSNSVTDEQAVLFLATGLTHGEASPEPTEALEVRWVPFDEALAMSPRRAHHRRDERRRHPASRPGPGD